MIQIQNMDESQPLLFSKSEFRENLQLTMEVNADAIASVVLEEFRKLPAKRKPTVRDNGLREWVPLSGVVVQGVLLCS